ncbi:MAG: hypothetical protein PHE32_02545 [Candidatus Shapirobacteria bacterium]|nr:hypothetical protein [Candidatus Shapirobacteria bacterium]MDD4410551.1 hypothetical protein [Candidatus Shapirobacteria bacterium]
MQNIILNVFKSALYPPTEDQLAVIRYFFNNLWVLRIFSLIILLLALFFWYKLIIKLAGKKVSLISCLLVSISPTFYILWLTCPTECFKIFLLVLLVFVLNKNKNYFRRFILILGSIYIILFSFLVTKERSSFVHKIGLNDAKNEIIERFIAEDSLTDPIKIPLSVKRIVYNKYFIEYKELVNEIIPFFDMESLFFQEVHPTEQKSIVIFVWPEIFLLIGGVYLLIKIKDKKINSLVILMLFFSLINFLFDPFITFRKFDLILFPLSLIMALAVGEIYKTKIFFGKIFGLVIVFLSLYGTIANYSDLNKRPDFWLDNRPYFYEFIFNSIKKREPNNFEKIYVTSLVGKSERYCKYYLTNCDENKFVYDSFGLEKNKPGRNTIYAGFAGEFIGTDFKNNINKDWLALIKEKDFTNIEIKSLRDTIAYKFGNNIVVGEIK